MTEIIVAIATPILTGVVSIFVCLINNKSQHEKTIALFDYKIGELQRQVEKHNNVIARTHDLETTKAVLEEQIKVINHRIDDLEKEMN